MYMYTYIYISSRNGSAGSARSEMCRSCVSYKRLDLFCSQKMMGVLVANFLV